jgi:putative oxidoreductase
VNRSSPFALVPDWGMVPLRLGAGIVFVMHGYQKLFIFGIDGTTNFMAGVGIPAPQVAAVLVTALELLGGLALIVGLFTKWSALLLAGDMAVAVLAVKLKGGFFAPQGAELELTLLAALLTLAAMGPGGFSLDAARAAKRRSAGV